VTAKEQPKFKWRNSQQLQGVRSQLQAALNACTNGCYVEVGTTDLRNAIEVCLQAEHASTALLVMLNSIKDAIHNANDESPLP